MLYTVFLISSAGEGAANDHRRYISGRDRYLPGLPRFLRLGFGNGLYLFLNRWEQAELGKSRRRYIPVLLGRRSGGLFARRFPLLIIYL